MIAEAELAYNDAETDEILLWVVCGEPKDLEVCQDHGWIGTPAHQQAYLRNASGKRATRYADVTEATISSPKKPVPCRTCPEETNGKG